MAKGCGNCGKMHQYSMLECIQGSAAPTVERVPLHPELTTPSVPSQPSKSTVTPSNSTVTDDSSTVTLPKNRAWEQRNSERYRKWRREYMRKRRADD